MACFKLMVVLLIGLLQVCTASPASQEEKDPAKLLTADELTRAENAGISRNELVKFKSLGGTLDELIKIEVLRSDPTYKATLSFENMARFCEVLVPGYIMTSSNHTRAQVADLRDLLQLGDDMPISFMRTTICDFVSNPNSPSFGPKVVPHTKIRLLKIQVETHSGLERVYHAKGMCCLDEGGYLVRNKEVIGLRDEEMAEFEKQWNQFDSTNVPESIKSLCDFLLSTNTFDGDQCQKYDVVDKD